MSVRKEDPDLGKGASRVGQTAEIMIDTRLLRD